jgi:hypothetical protein
MLQTNSFVRVIALDFSKAFDTVKHNTLFEKLASLPLPDQIYNWLLDFFLGRQHNTRVKDAVSAAAPLLASVVQGSALCPALYSINAADLHNIIQGNDMKKYADDTYLIIPEINSQSASIELQHISDWALSNNLNLNQSKSEEIIFHKPHLRSFKPPPEIPSIKRVSSLKILGVTITDKLRVTPHIDATISSCSQSFFALRTLKAHGLSGKSAQAVFRATSVSKIMYCSSAWWGYTNSEDQKRLDDFICKSKKLGFCSDALPSIAELISTSDEKYFNRTRLNRNHILHSLLPPPTQHTHSLRNRRHNLQLPSTQSCKNDSFVHKNFISRMLLRDSY